MPIDDGLSPIWSSDGVNPHFRPGSYVIAAKVARGPKIDVSLAELLFDGSHTSISLATNATGSGGYEAPDFSKVGFPCLPELVLRLKVDPELGGR